MRFLLLLPAVVFTAASLPAQKIHRLVDGTRVEARAQVQRKVVLLQTVFGERKVPRERYAGPDQTERSALREEYARRVAALDEDDAHAHHALGRWCERKGYLTGLREQLEEVLTHAVDDPWARRTLAAIAKDYVVHSTEKGDRGRDRRNLARFLFEHLAKRDLVGAVIACEKAKRLPLAVTWNYAIDALRKEPDPAVRWVGAAVLALHRDEPARIRHLYHHALMDKAAAVRTESVRSLEVTEDPVFVRLFAKNLDHGHSGVRLHAAEALEELGDASAVPMLIAALANGGSAPRNHVMRTTRRAYVKDFDVEIAQAAVIADPIVDVVTEGTVLDVAVVSVTQELRGYRRALRTLTGADFGFDAAAWRRWWAEQQR